MAQKDMMNFSALGKIFTIVLLQNVCNFKATVGVSTYRNNGSTYFCPSFGKITLRWHEFHPFTHYNSSSKALEGNLVNYMRKALNICCPNLEIIHEKVDINSSCEMEILIRQTAPDEPRVYFPIFANRGDGEQFERRFLGLFDSPGPAVLKVNHGIASSSNEILYFLKDVWTIVVISFLHAVLAGMIIWYLDHESNPQQFPSGSIYGMGNGIWWAFVTMTTVGYGDKSPHSTLARAFAVLWMIEGTVLTALFAAQLTADLTADEITKELNLIDRKVGVPLGMETFLVKEFNYAAHFEELEHFHDLEENMETYESLEYLIFFDYVEAQELLKNGHMKNIVIEKNIAHKYSVGMILIGNFVADDESFFTCWRRELVDNREIERALERCANKENAEEPTKGPLSFSTYVVITSAGCLMFSLTLIVIREYRRLKRQNNVVAINNS